MADETRAAQTANLVGAHIIMTLRDRTLLGTIIDFTGDGQLIVRHFNGEPWPIQPMADTVEVLAMSESQETIIEMRQMVARARLAFFREALPIAKTETDLTLARSIAGAIGEVSPEEGMAAFRRELARRQVQP